MIALAALCLAAVPAPAEPQLPEEPERTSFTSRVVTLPDGRSLELEIGRDPALDARRTKGTILFSHGANSAPERYRRLTSHWVKSAYVVVSALHIDAERHPARETKDRDLVLRTRRGDTAGLFALAAPDKPLFIAGHSFGALIAQLIGGEQEVTANRPARLAGIIAMSPPPSSAWTDPGGPIPALAIPMLVQTGTCDVQPGFADSWTRHLDSYHAAPAHLRWKAVYPGGDHYFGGMIGRPSAAPAARGRGQLRHFADLTLRFMEFAAKRQARPPSHAAPDAVAPILLEEHSE